MLTNVLLIDDHLPLLESLQDLFEDHGLVLDVAASWEDGLESFKRGMHELVIADYNLPGSKNGLLLLAGIKALVPTTRLILISGAFLSEPEQLIAQSKIVDRFLEKDANLVGELLAEAREAGVRAGQDIPWSDAAKAYVQKAELDLGEIERIDEALRKELKG
jgi:DNA-binding response OmpR family regulator